ncbi:MAG: hypothetical protein PUC82_00230 [bacterium]|nr:hypothetical protein [bacterium]
MAKRQTKVNWGVKKESEFPVYGNKFVKKPSKKREIIIIMIAIIYFSPLRR